ncbi:MucR family transcriptional regulator [Brevundimonas sp.]|uniref:MucR family transcriptional regulator n=1 Tax=Brevundimonas sp. TaxID=1871086 RepID=UPI00286AB415|nr:MucR family transcriptional regulator [Brevundimonas sp.]
MVDDTFDASSDSFDGTVELVSAFVSNTNNRLTAEELQSLIRDTFATLSSLSHGGPAEAAEEPETYSKSKAEIRKSIGPDSLISFEDGKGYQSLKRHLSGRGLTPEGYRAKYGLPQDYPMVHPAYSARRSELAKSIGLGSKGRQAKAASPKAPARKPRTPKAPAE